MQTPELIHANWPAPASVVAFSTTRHGGVSQAPFDTFNLGDHVGDNPEHVAQNRQTLQSLLDTPAACQYVKQEHGAAVIEANDKGETPVADAVYAGRNGQPCAVMTADCVPIFLCNQSGNEVAVVHAGWRGLIEGVISAAVRRFCSSASHMLAYIGPAIGPKHYEVDADFRETFLARMPTQFRTDVAIAFKPTDEEKTHWMADLIKLTRVRLLEAGVHAIFGGDRCTYAEPENFFSHRRDAECGRQAHVIMLR